MRLRNIPGARDVIAGHEAVIKEEKQWKGRWDQVFENDHPIRLEIGMGKGQFLMQMALQNPDINYIGNRALFQCSSTCTGADERIGGGTVQSPVCVYGRVRDR